MVGERSKGEVIAPINIKDEVIDVDADPTEQEPQDAVQYPAEIVDGIVLLNNDDDGVIFVKEEVNSEEVVFIKEEALDSEEYRIIQLSPDDGERGPSRR